MGVIVENGRTYYPHDCFVDPDRYPELLTRRFDRRTYSSFNALRLASTCGAWVDVLGRRLKLVVDPDEVAPGSPEWGLIGRAATLLSQVAGRLCARSQQGLGVLRGVVFVSRPSRSYADVDSDCFVYDTDEFWTHRPDTQERVLVSAAWVASNIVHDSCHVWLQNNGLPYTGEAVEKELWQLQIDNAGPLGLHSVEVDHLRWLIANPQSVLHRMNSDPHR